VITILKYLDRQLTKRERRTVIRYLRQYKNLEAIIYSKEMDLIPSRSSEFKETPVQESNEFHSQAEEYTMKKEELDNYKATKEKLDSVYNSIKPTQKLIWDEHFIIGRMDADIYYGHDITKRTYYKEKNELLLIVAECLGVGTK